MDLSFIKMQVHNSQEFGVKYPLRHGCQSTEQFEVDLRLLVDLHEGQDGGDLFRGNRVDEDALDGLFKVLETRTLRWRHNERDSVPNHQPHDCLFNRLFRRRSKITSKLRVTGLCAGNSPGTGEFPAQMASYAENVSIWWRHHEQKRR